MAALLRFGRLDERSRTIELKGAGIGVVPSPKQMPTSSPSKTSWSILKAAILEIGCATNTTSMPATRCSRRPASGHRRRFRILSRLVWSSTGAVLLLAVGKRSFRQRLVVAAQLISGVAILFVPGEEKNHSSRSRWVQVARSRPRPSSHERNEAATLRHWVAAVTWDSRTRALSACEARARAQVPGCEHLEELQIRSRGCELGQVLAHPSVEVGETFVSAF